MALTAFIVFVGVISLLVLWFYIQKKRAALVELPNPTEPLVPFELRRPPRP